MDPRAHMDTGEDKSLWPMVRIEQFLGRQVRYIVTIHSELSQILSGSLATFSLCHRIQHQKTRRQK